MDIKKIEHVAINIADFEQSMDFYGRILEFKRLQTVNCGDFDVTYFGLPDGSRLELFDYHGNSRSTPRQESEIGLRHLAFQVRGVAAHETRLRAEGVQVTLPTTELPDLGARVLLFLDPNGVTLEFCEPL